MGETRRFMSRSFPHLIRKYSFYVHFHACLSLITEEKWSSYIKFIPFSHPHFLLHHDNFHSFAILFKRQTWKFSTLTTSSLCIEGWIECHFVLCFIKYCGRIEGEENYNHRFVPWEYANAASRFEILLCLMIFVYQSNLVRVFPRKMFLCPSKKIWVIEVEFLPIHRLPP